MSAQPEHAPVPPPPPGPAAAAQLLALIREDRRAARWVPAFERDWAKALADSGDSFTLTPLHDVVRTWQARVEAASAVDAFVDDGKDDSEFATTEAVFGVRG